jgi:aminopeptidase N
MLIRLFLFFSAYLFGTFHSIQAFERDWHTFSNYNDIVTSHVVLDLHVDFSKKQLRGTIEHHLKYIKKKVSHLILDTKNLDIHHVYAFQQKQWKKVSFKLDKKDAIRGKKLTIHLPNNVTRIKIDYNSRLDSSGLQWLSPEQTSGKKFPFMFSQSQAIHARTWMPIQDTPAMRVTYSAKIKTPPHLLSVMSAKRLSKKNKTGSASFEMKQAIPPYLIAIAAGNIHYKKMSKQTGIYSEPELLDAAVFEFEDTQRMIDVSEHLYGKYSWEVYDLLILPPSFPFGGMENPRLSFITPTVLAGDKSLVSLIAHELAHSWSGNLVTNATWRDLWLNEGFTSYVENRIMEGVYGTKRAIMEQSLALKSLNDDLKALPKEDTILYLTMKNRDPDDSFTNIPYYKGQFFLMRLEECFGRKHFDTFLKQYFNDHAFMSIDTPSFTRYLKKHLIDRYPNKISMKEVNIWLNEPLLPKTAPHPISNAFTLVEKQISRWFKKGKITLLKTNQWSVHEWLHFIHHLPLTITIKQLKQLDAQFKLTVSKNTEIAHAWFLLNIKQKNADIYPSLSKYLISIGRRKLIIPLYEALSDDKTTHALAKTIYKKARPGYHSLARSTLDPLIEKLK